MTTKLIATAANPTYVYHDHAYTKACEATYTLCAERKKRTETEDKNEIEISVPLTPEETSLG